MKISKLMLFAIMPFFALTGCFTTHSPVYVQSSQHGFLPAGVPEVHADINRNYFLFFGGANKRPMMADARQKLSEKYAGFCPFEFVNISSDEAKSTFFLLYNKHSLTVSGSMVFKNSELVFGARKAVTEIENNGFAEGDRVYFTYDDGYSKMTLQGAISFFAGSKAVIHLDSTSQNNPRLKFFDGFVKLKELTLLPKYMADYHEGDLVNFKPRGYSGEPFYAFVGSFYSNYTAGILLSEDDKTRWIQLGGVVDDQGLIYVPTFRLFK